MSEELPDLVPMHIRQLQEPFTVLETPAAPPRPREAASMEQAQATDAVFSAAEERQLVEGMFGMWCGAVLLADMAKEHFHLPEQEKSQADSDDKDPDDEDGTGPAS